MEAIFLSSAERVSVIEHIKANETGISNRAFNVKHLTEAVLDLRLWLMWLLILLEGGGGGVITTYSATIIKNFGYTSQQSALLNMPTGAISIVTSLLGAAFVTYYGHRWLILALMTIAAIVGAGLMTWAPSHDRSALLAGIYLANFSVATTPILFGWMSVNVAGNTKRSVAMTALNAAFAIGNIIGPQTFQARNAPDYKPAKLAMFSFQCAFLAMVCVLSLLNKFENKRRDRETIEDEQDVSESKAFAGLTDKENRNFRYMT